MSRKKKILVNCLLSVIIMTAVLLILEFTYQLGRDKGRSETVEIIQTLADEYTFKRIVDSETESWTLGSGSGGQFFPNYDGSTLMYSYDWDDGKIHLSYEK